MELHQLRTLLEVARTGSLTRAAQTLHLSQPAVSAQIKSLETELGMQLFRRSSHGVVPTAPGEQLLKAAEDLVRRSEGLLRLAARLRDGMAGTLHLGTIDSGYDLKLARILGQMTQRHPEVEVQLTTANSGTHSRNVLDGEVDVAIVEGDIDEPRLLQIPLASTRVGIIGPAAWARELRDADWRQLSELPWICQAPGCSYHTLLMRLSREHRVEFKQQFHAEAFGAMKDLVAEGLALSIADLHDAEEMVEAGQLFVWPHFEMEMPVSIVMLRQRASEPMLKAFAGLAVGIHRRSITRRQARPLAPSAESA